VTPWQKRAKEVLAPFRWGADNITTNDNERRLIIISGDRADSLEQKICEALAEAYNEGWQSGYEGDPSPSVRGIE
jgi:hypothetical protein